MDTRQWANQENIEFISWNFANNWLQTKLPFYLLLRTIFSEKVLRIRKIQGKQGKLISIRDENKPNCWFVPFWSESLRIHAFRACQKH